jgi:hypothetical protein
MAKTIGWIEKAINAGIPPFDASDIILDVSESLTEENLPHAAELFTAAIRDYLEAKKA